MAKDNFNLPSQSNSGFHHTFEGGLIKPLTAAPASIIGKVPHRFETTLMMKDFNNVEVLKLATSNAQYDAASRLLMSEWDDIEDTEKAAILLAEVLCDAHKMAKLYNMCMPAKTRVRKNDVWFSSQDVRAFVKKCFPGSTNGQQAIVGELVTDAFGSTALLAHGRPASAIATGYNRGVSYNEMAAEFVRCDILAAIQNTQVRLSPSSDAFLGSHLREQFIQIMHDVGSAVKSHAYMVSHIDVMLTAVRKHFTRDLVFQTDVSAAVKESAVYARMAGNASIASMALSLPSRTTRPVASDTAVLASLNAVDRALSDSRRIESVTLAAFLAPYRVTRLKDASEKFCMGSLVSVDRRLQLPSDVIYISRSNDVQRLNVLPRESNDVNALIAPLQGVNLDQFSANFSKALVSSIYRTRLSNKATAAFIDNLIESTDEQLLAMLLSDVVYISQVDDLTGKVDPETAQSRNSRDLLGELEHFTYSKVCPTGLEVHAKGVITEVVSTSPHDILAISEKEATSAIETGHFLRVAEVRDTDFLDDHLSGQTFNYGGDLSIRIAIDAQPYTIQTNLRKLLGHSERYPGKMIINRAANDSVTDCFASMFDKLATAADWVTDLTGSETTAEKYLDRSYMFFCSNIVKLVASLTNSTYLDHLTRVLSAELIAKTTEDDRIALSNRLIEKSTVSQMRFWTGLAILQNFGYLDATISVRDHRSNSQVPLGQAIVNVFEENDYFDIVSAEDFAAAELTRG